MLSKFKEKDRNVHTVLRHAIEKHEKQATNKYEQNNEQIMRDDNKNGPVKRTTRNSEERITDKSD